MERANASVVRVKESRERERRDMCSSMAARGGGREEHGKGKEMKWNRRCYCRYRWI